MHSEVPLPTYPGKRMDALISGDRGHQMALEFKYHREKLSTLPKPQLAGGMFADLFRLGTAHHALRCDCYFVYLTDTTMVAYLKQHRHGCVDVFSLPEGLKLRLGVGVLEGKTKTFHRALRSTASLVEVEVLLRADLHGGLHLLVYQVAHVPDSIYDHG